MQLTWMDGPPSTCLNHISAQRSLVVRSTCLVCSSAVFCFHRFSCSLSLVSCRQRTGVGLSRIRPTPFLSTTLTLLCNDIWRPCGQAADPAGCKSVRLQKCHCWSGRNICGHEQSILWSTRNTRQVAESAGAPVSAHIM